MSSNLYYGVKDAEFNLGFVETEWLTLNEAVSRLKLVNTGAYFSISTPHLIYPNELVMSEANSIIDILLLAKYTDKCGNLKLKSVLLSHLLKNNSSLSLKSHRLYILSLPKDSYYWSKVDAHLIPAFALRVGYDAIAKQFSYIGRMRVNLSSPGCASPVPANQKAKNSVTNTLSGLIGTLTNIYEYIPAIVLQLHDLSYMNDKKLFSNINSDTNAQNWVIGISNSD